MKDFEYVTASGRKVVFHGELEEKLTMSYDFIDEIPVEKGLGLSQHGWISVYIGKKRVAVNQITSRDDTNLQIQTVVENNAKFLHMPEGTKFIVLDGKYFGFSPEVADKLEEWLDELFSSAITEETRPFHEAANAAKKEREIKTILSQIEEGKKQKAFMQAMGGSFPTTMQEAQERQRAFLDFLMDEEREWEDSHIYSDEELFVLHTRLMEIGGAA